MPIPEAQLDTWSRQGAMVQSSTTYGIVKSALETSDAGYAAKDYDVFLQGSYGNDTNIYAESDVDVVICCNSMFHHDLSELSTEDHAAFKATHSDATYRYKNFKDDVTAVLTKKFGTDVEPGAKAIRLKPGGSRRSADVIVAIGFRRYHRFRTLNDQSYDQGICFYPKTGSYIANYPKQHSTNCTAKHQASSLWFKPMVRIVKNMRSRLVETGEIESSLAPSYFIEGLLYNVPPENFGKTYADTFVAAYNWIVNADRDKFVCANEQYYLLRETPVTWPAEDCAAFLDALAKLWKEWS